jgi:hypothetical protein
MITKEWTTIDKSEWGPGPWQEEVDKKQWQDPETGLPCLIVRNPRGGFWCGYVGVPPCHPFHGVKTYEDAEGREDFLYDLDCHGGVTYAGKCYKVKDESEGICHVTEPGEPDDVWWIGFDCTHAWDFRPGEEHIMRELVLKYYPQSDGEIYRSQVYVEAECTELAKQLKAKENL